MPAPGTKRIEIDGRNVHLPADEVELENLIETGLELEAEKQEIEESLKRVRERVVAIAEKKRGERKSVTLVAPTAGAARVVFGTETRIDEERARGLERELPPGVFFAVFSKTTRFSMKRGYQGFMRTPQAPDLEKLKTKIGAALEFKPKNPSVKFLADARDVVEAEDEGE
ncbi:MAG TPA: hypothetical protein VKP14_06210 [Gaiellaceae bacterium]|nr:hypothetical protein [Gaiellaceae bacterium]